MNKIKKILIFIFFCFQITHLFSQNNDSVLVHKFFEIYESGNVEESLKYIFSTNEWIQKDTKIIDSTKNELEGILSVLGKYYGYKLIKKANLENCYAIYSFLLKYDRQPIRFVFLLYKPQDKWRFQTFNFDGNLSEEMYNTINISWDY